MKKRWRNAGLYVLLAVVVIAVGTAFLDRPDPANAPRTLRYSDFVEAVEGNEVSRVLIAPDRGTAQVVENNGQRAVVNLAPDKDLLKLLEDHKVDIAVEPSRQAQPWQQAIGSLIFPLLLLGEGEGALPTLANVFGWAFTLWGIGLYWWAGLLYAWQVRRLLATTERRVANSG